MSATSFGTDILADLHNRESPLSVIELKLDIVDRSDVNTLAQMFLELLCVSPIIYVYSVLSGAPAAAEKNIPRDCAFIAS